MEHTESDLVPAFVETEQRAETSGRGQRMARLWCREKRRPGQGQPFPPGCCWLSPPNLESAQAQEPLVCARCEPDLAKRLSEQWISQEVVNEREGNNAAGGEVSLVLLIREEGQLFRGSGLSRELGVGPWCG